LLLMKFARPSCGVGDRVEPPSYAVHPRIRLIGGDAGLTSGIPKISKFTSA